MINIKLVLNSDKAHIYIYIYKMCKNNIYFYFQ